MTDHQIRWFVYETPGGELVPHAASHRGQWPGFEAKCSCGWESHSGGATRTFIKRAIAEHKLDAELDGGGSAVRTARQTDEALAALYTDLYRIEDRLAGAATEMLRAAGATFYYRGRQRVTDMTLDEAAEKLTARAAYVREYKASHAYVEQASYGEYHGTNWDDFQGAPHSADAAAEALARRSGYEAQHRALTAKIDALEAEYTGWSRFFLVTSSNGHVHSSMSCSTCRPTTRFGWLPALSGQNEQDAVKALGPTLCSVCFPTAPVAWTEGKKLTASQAAKKIAALA